MNPDHLETAVRDSVRGRAGGIIMNPDTVEQAWTRFQGERAQASTTRRRKVFIGAAVGAATAAAVTIAVAAGIGSDEPPEPVTTVTPSPTTEPGAGRTFVVEPQAPDAAAYAGNTYIVELEKVSFSIALPPEVPGVTGWGLDVDPELSTVYATYAESAAWPQIAVYATEEVYDPRVPVYVGDDAGLPAPTTVAGWIEWFADHPYWDTSPAQPVELDGATGQTFEVSNVQQPAGWLDPDRAGGICCVVTGSAGNIGAGIETGGQARVWVLDVEGVPVVVVYSAVREAKFEEYRPAFEGMVDSMEWNPPLP